MADRRLVGMDLGIASAHTVRVLAEDGREVCRRRCEPTVAEFSRIEAAALAGAESGTRLEVVIALGRRRRPARAPAAADPTSLSGTPRSSWAGSTARAFCVGFWRCR